jgi:hypothetical protein
MPSNLDQLRSRLEKLDKFNSNRLRILIWIEKKKYAMTAAIVLISGMIYPDIAIWMIHAVTRNHAKVFALPQTRNIVSFN